MAYQTDRQPEDIFKEVNNFGVKPRIHSIRRSVKKHDTIHKLNFMIAFYLQAMQYAVFDLLVEMLFDSTL